MAITIFHDSVKEIVDFLGLKGKSVYEIKILMNMDSAVSIEAKMYIEDKQMDGINKVLKKYELEARQVAEIKI